MRAVPCSFCCVYTWERDALGIDTLGEIRGALLTRMRIESAAANRAAWWIATLYGPDFWQHWRVGLLRETLVGIADRPVDPPDPLVLKLPKHVAARVTAQAELDEHIAVCPAIIDEKALAFAVAAASEEEVAAGHVAATDRWCLVAPSDLSSRLSPIEGRQVRVRLVPASAHRAGRPHG